MMMMMIDSLMMMVLGHDLIRVRRVVMMMRLYGMRRLMKMRLYGMRRLMIMMMPTGSHDMTFKSACLTVLGSVFGKAVCLGFWF